METLTKEEFLDREEKMISDMKSGKVFIYPTDTIYGIGCNALNGEGVKKIREIKKRDEKPFSIIVPSKEWIKKKCYVSDTVESWIAKLPGPYTLILELKDWEAVAREVNGGKDSLGVRIPDNWFASIVGELGMPFVTTSVNLSGEEPIREISELSGEMKEKVDYVIDVGRIDGRASKIVNLLRVREEIRER